MTNREKLAAIKATEGYVNEISDILEGIISHTYDHYITGVDKFQVDGESVGVSYWYTCRGEHGGDYVAIPTEWLDEGFDYMAAYEEECERHAKKARRAEARARKAAEEAEYKEFLRLKNKFDKKGKKGKKQA